MKIFAGLLTCLTTLGLSLSAAAQPICLGLQTEWLLKSRSPEGLATLREQLVQRLTLEQQTLGLEQALPQVLPHPEADHLSLCLAENYPLAQILAKRQDTVQFEILQPMKGTPQFWAPTGLNGSQLLKVTLKNPNAPGLEIQLNEAGSKILARLSVGLHKQNIALLLNNRLLMTPQILSFIPDGKVILSGPNPQELEALAQKLEAARLPWPEAELLAIEIGKYSETLQKQVPPEVTEILDKHYPGWYFPKGLSAIGQEHYWQEKPTFTPYWIKADFDGNGQQDHALQIRHPAGKEGTRETILILRRQNSGQYQPLVLDQTAPAHLRTWSGASLWRYPAGSKMYNFETEKEFLTPQETLALHFWGKGALAWIWNGNSFQEVTIGD